MKKITTLTAIVAVLALAACGSSNSSKSSSSASTSSNATAAASGGGGYGSGSSKNTTASTSSGSSAIQVGMVDNSFTRKTITGKAGSTVKVELKNTGQNEHNFKIDGQKKADADVKPGTSATVSVIIPKSGTVQFYCEYHKGLGMVGTVKPS